MDWSKVPPLMLLRWIKHDKVPLWLFNVPENVMQLTGEGLKGLHHAQLDSATLPPLHQLL